MTDLDRWTYTIALLIPICQALDILITYIGLQFPFLQEANPLMASFLDNMPLVALLKMSVGIYAGLVIFWVYRLQPVKTRTGEFVWSVGLCGVGIFSLWPLFHNLMLMLIGLVAWQ